MYYFDEKLLAASGTGAFVQDVFPGKGETRLRYKILMVAMQPGVSDAIQIRYAGFAAPERKQTEA